MGICVSNSNCESLEKKGPARDLLLSEKVKNVQKEKKEIMCRREEESRVYEREMVRFERRAAEWKKTRKKLEEEVKELKKVVGEKEERLREREICGFLVEQMEKDRKDEAGEKWKKLYLAMKTELDGLIERTITGERVYGKTVQKEMIEELRRKVKAKEDTIEVLQAQLTSAKQGESKKSREADILRQSLRIVSNQRRKDGCRALRKTN